MHRHMKIGIAYVYRHCPLLTSEGWSDGPLRLHLEVWNHHVAVESGQIDHRSQISCLHRHQKQPTVETQGLHVGDTLYGSLHQQGINGLLKVLSAVPGPETDALMGELRSLLEYNAHPVLDDAGGPAVAQQTPPVRGKVCQASPTWDPSTFLGCGRRRRLARLLASLEGSWTGPSGASSKGRLLFDRPLRCGWRGAQPVKHGRPRSRLLGRHLRAGLDFFLLGESHWWACHMISLSDGPDPRLKYLWFRTNHMVTFKRRCTH